MKKIISTIIGVVATLVITTLSIDATDTLTGRGGTMLAGVFGAKDEALCPLGMMVVPTALTFTCVDMFEATASEGCTFQNPKNQFETEINSVEKDCEVVSSEVGLPWRFVSREQARVLCAKSGKRLPTAKEWYDFALGTSREGCVIDGGDVVEGKEQLQCLSAHGVVGTVGNVWEWVSDDVVEGEFGTYILPDSGYIKEVSSSGMATKTSVEMGTSSSLGYFWSQKNGSFGVLRGGFYASKDDASVYTAHAHTEVSFVGGAVGFRCVR